MTRKQMKEWQDESVRQAYEQLEAEILTQHSGHVAITSVPLIVVAAKK